MKFRFIGDPMTPAAEGDETPIPKGPRRVALYGYSFALDGPPVEVDGSTDDGKVAVRKLSANSHFAIVQDAPPGVVGTETEASHGGDHESGPAEPSADNPWGTRRGRNR